MFSSSMKKKECWKHINLFPSLFFSSSLLNDEQLVSLLLLKKKNTEKDKGFFKCFFFFFDGRWLCSKSKLLLYYSNYSTFYGKSFYVLKKTLSPDKFFFVLYKK